MNNITVKNAFDKFKDFKESYCDSSTCKYYEQNLSFFFDFLEQEYEKPINRISMDILAPDIVQSYIKYLRFKPKFENHTYKIGEAKKGKLKNSTIRIYTRAVKVFVNYIRDDLDCKIKFKRPRLPTNDTRIQLPLYSHEVQALDQVFLNSTEMGLRNLCIIHLMLDGGLRSEEYLLRHTFAVSYLVGGGNLEFIRDMLGHSDYTTTRNYVKMANQMCISWMIFSSVR